MRRDIMLEANSALGKTGSSYKWDFVSRTGRTVMTVLIFMTCRCSLCPVVLLSSSPDVALFRLTVPLRNRK